jgi:transposase
MSEAEIEARLFPGHRERSETEYPLPDWAAIHKEKKKEGVTLALLWAESKQQYPDGYQYTQFCEYYRRWKETLDTCLRQEHQAGEKLFVDYCGQTASVTDRTTGETKAAQIFVAALGASNCTYAEATSLIRGVDAAVARLDRVARARPGIFRRLSGGAGARQSA